jgi:hypothetical protein
MDTGDIRHSPGVVEASNKKPTKFAKVLILLTSIRKVPVSNSSEDTDYSDSGFFVVFVSLSSTFREYILS